MKFLSIALVTIASLYFLIGAGLYLFQRHLLYYPTKEVSVANAEILYLNQDSTRLKVWKIDNEAESAIIYFGGNAEPVSYNIDNLRAVVPGRDIYLLNYRGYGGSDGSPSEAALYADALALYDLIKDDYSDIAVIGRSLGSGVATHLGANRPVDKLALITPYDSITNVIQAKFPIYPVRVLLHDKYNSAANAARIEAPVLILLAEGDGVIPRPHSDALAAQFPSPPQIVVIPATDHLSVSQPSAFWVTLSEFFSAREDVNS